MSLKAIARRLRKAEDGFSMVVTMGAVSLMLMTSAFAVDAVSGDQSVGRADRDRKSAYAAAEAGLQVYVHKLLVDNTYWARCEVKADGLNQFWPYAKGTDPKTDPRTWVNLSDGTKTTSATGAYTIESVPVPGQTKCDPAKAEETMIPAGTPTFRVRVTGQSVVDGRRVGPKRALIATFKRKSFLDYIYFTDFETLDPDTYRSSLAKGMDTIENKSLDIRIPQQGRNIIQWGQDACGQYSYTPFEANKGEGKKLRKDQLFRGTGPSAGRKATATATSYDSWTQGCSEINFVTGDWIRGPFHTNDTPMICGQPKFGRRPSDIIEVSGPADTTKTNWTTSWRPSTSGGCGTNDPGVNLETDPTIDPNLGMWKFNAKPLQMPTSNTSIKSEVTNQYYFIGRTRLELRSDGVKVTGKNKAGNVYNGDTIPYPPNGVIYVDNDTCTDTYNTADPRDTARGGCGIAQVLGDYNTSMTIAAADDIQIVGNIKMINGSQSVLGLVSNNFIRVNHPIVEQSACGQQNNPTSLTDGPGTMYDVRIDAALLALKHSFIVDNWQCGDKQGTLTVNGAIAQKFRGPVGTGSKSSGTGYTKLYEYDDRLRVRIPPSFIDPVQSAWGIQTYQEQAQAK
ncbi:MAG: pilus assembly PilX N-terminal domain-containing protein [Patulibacter minatonensis]